MLKQHLPCFANLNTPFYFYDLTLLQQTVSAIKQAVADRPDFKLHYAVKANANPVLLRFIAEHGLGADTVSKGEIELALANGFAAEDIVFAGVGKTDDEIAYAIKNNILALNIESVEELAEVARIAAHLDRQARVWLRINPDIDAHTHHYITTGLKENKFGIDRSMLDKAVGIIKNSANLDFCGVHFHIGSQITAPDCYRLLCRRALETVSQMQNLGLTVKNIDLGGGIGVDYDHPDVNPVPDFGRFFDVFAKELPTVKGRTYHFEPGRSLVAQCGSLITRVLYVKQGLEKLFVITDAGMTELLRPALYGAMHCIQNLSAEGGAPTCTYDVVGPVCESTDVFATQIGLPKTHRGDLLALRTAGAYGESMASHYNGRRLNPAYIAR